jgi:serine carboxypeptidase-like clade 2
MEGNKKAHHKKDRFNLKGIMIGNAAVDASSDDRGMVEYAWDHAVISDEVYGAIKKECKFPDDGDESAACNQAWNDLFHAMQNIDIYSLYTPACTDALANATRSNSSSAASPWKVAAGTPLAVSRRRKFQICRLMILSLLCWCFT